MTTSTFRPPLVMTVPLALLIGLLSAVGAGVSAPPAAEAASWHTVRENCHRSAAGRACAVLQRDGSSDRHRIRYRVRANSGQWIRLYDGIRIEMAGDAYANRSVCGGTCPRVSGRSWSSRWIRADSSKVLASAVYAKRGDSSVYLAVGRGETYRGSSTCSDTGRVCAAIYIRRTDDTWRFFARASVNPADGSWIEPRSLRLKLQKNGKTTTKTWSGRRSGYWADRGAARTHRGWTEATATFRFTTPNGTFTLTDTYVGAG